MKAVTREEVARAAGVSPAAVSLALRGRAGVSEATRTHIKRVAESLGYRISSAASVLAQQRVRPDGPARLAVAMLMSGSGEAPEFTEAAKALGLEPHRFYVEKLPTSAEATSRMLWTRGISGLLLDRNLPRFFGAEVEQFAWERFSVIKIGRARPELCFRLVRHSPFDYLAMGLEEILRRGYRRVAVLLHRTPSERDDLARLGALLAFREWKLPPGVICEWRDIGAANGRRELPEPVLRWLRGFRPDAVLAPTPHAYEQLTSAGLLIPGEVGFAAYLTSEAHLQEPPLISGVSIRSGELMRRALGVLHDMMVHNERGFTTEQAEYVIEPIWLEGETLP